MSLVEDKPIRAKVIIVPGFCSSGLEWRNNVISGRLEECGFDTEVFNACDLGTCDIWHNAKSLRTKMQLDSFNYHRVFLLGHSLGGLIARAANVSAWRKADGMITLNTPHYGAKLATLASWCEAGKQMQVDSEFLEALNKHASETPIMSVSSKLDYIAWPTRNCKLQGARQLELKLATHSSLLWSSRCANAVIDFFMEQI